MNMSANYRLIIALIAKGSMNNLHREDIVEVFRAKGVDVGFLVREDYIDLIERIPDPEDRRSIRVLLTDSGVALQEEIFNVFLSRTQELLHSVSPGKLREIDNSLRILLDGIERHFYR